MIKKILVIISLLIFIISFSAFSAETNSFNDIDNHWAKPQLIKLMDSKIINGYSDNTFRPNNSITRAEFIKMINSAFGFQKEKEINFSDIKSNDWFYNEICKANNIGYIKGYTDETFRPNKNITREEASLIISRLHSLENEYISGYEDNNFRPFNELTRAEATVLIDRIAGKIINIESNNIANGIYENEIINENMTISSSDITIKNFTINGDLYFTEGINEGTITLDNVIVSGKTLIKGSGTYNINMVNTNLNSVFIDNESNISLINQDNVPEIKIKKKSTHSTVISPPVITELITTETPIISTTSQTINSDYIIINGTAEVGAMMEITNNSSITTKAAIDGIYSISIALNQNETNEIIVKAKATNKSISSSSGIQIIEDSIAPIGYTIDIDKDIINKNDIDIIALNISDAEVNTKYLYEIKDKDGLTIKGAGIIQSSTIIINDIDISSLTDGPISASIILTDQVDNSGIKQEHIFLKDKQSPIIAINGLAYINTTIGQSYTDLGAEVTDNVDVSIALTTSNTVVTTELGIYQVMYLAEDSAGNTSSEIRTVEVIEAVPPPQAPVIISVVGAEYGTFEVGIGLSDYIAVTFDKDTNTGLIPIRDSLNKSEVDNIISFYEKSFGNEYIGYWIDLKTFIISVADATGINFAIGDSITIKESAGIKTADGLSASSTSSGICTGSF